MNRYVNTELIKNQIFGLEKIEYNDVFSIYYDSEYEKWMKYHDENRVTMHFSKINSDFSSRKWFKGQIKISSLYQVTLCADTPWILKLACSRVDCKNHENEFCNPCIDIKERENPTLEKLINNRQFNIYYPHINNKISSMQESIARNGIGEIFVIICNLFNYSVPYVMDGNSRLISIATMHEMKDAKIYCYLGE